MTKENLYVYDTTLRDGQQTQGVQFSLAEKQQIAATLDALGIDYIEGRMARSQSDRQRLV